MDNHAEGQKTRTISKLDWPSHDVLMAARRARGKYLRELVVTFARWLRTQVAEHLYFALTLGRRKAKPARVRVASRR